jgi:hypothetical protein
MDEKKLSHRNSAQKPPALSAVLLENLSGDLDV